jgi:hypothetical protein
VGGSPAPAHAGIQREAARVRKRDEPTIPTPSRDDSEPRAGAAGADGGTEGLKGDTYETWLARDLGMSVQDVQRYLHDLAAMGFVFEEGR